MEHGAIGLKRIRLRHKTNQSAAPAWRSSRLRQFVVLLGGLLLLFALGTANAECTFINGYSVDNKTLSPVSGIITSEVTAIGSVIGEYSVRPASSNRNYANCTSPGTASRTVAGTLVSSNPYTYATDNPSVGVRFFDDSSTYGRRYWGGGAGESATGHWSWGTGQIGAELIALGPLKNTRVNTTAVATFSLDGLVIMTVRLSSVTISAKTCDTADVAVDIGEQMVTSFSGPGSTSPAKAFSIELTSCPPGSAGIFYTLDPLTSIIPDSDQSVVALDSSSTATGVGIQLLDGNNNPFAIATKTQLLDYDSSVFTDYSIPLSARYYQTDSRITPGTANTQLVFTISYQ